MEILAPTVTTGVIPHTYILLKKYLPSILKSKCFNDNNYPFDREVKNTEIGHLFEHILLEYLCMQKMAQGFENPVHNGLTSWNWEKDKRGIFHINIDAGHGNGVILKPALEKSISLTMKILNLYDAQIAV